jgi:hypothetical protein
VVSVTFCQRLIFRQRLHNIGEIAFQCRPVFPL